MPKREAFATISDLLVDYTQYSSIQGLNYMFCPYQVGSSKNISTKTGPKGFKFFILIRNLGPML